MEKSLFLFMSFIVFTTVLNAQRENLFLADKRYDNVYKEFIGEDEQLLASWYHFLITKNIKSRKYIYRTFYPEGKILTSEVTYRDDLLEVRSGPATYFHENGNIESIGKYKRNKKTGEWSYYYPNEGQLLSKGRYKNGRRTGEWPFFNISGERVGTYTYKGRKGKYELRDLQNNLLDRGFYNENDLRPKLRLLDGSFCMDCTPPILRECASLSEKLEQSECTVSGLSHMVHNNLVYPLSAQKKGVEGKGEIILIVGPEGKVEHRGVVVGLCKGITKELNILAQKLPDFIPGEVDGVPTKFMYTIPIQFSLN